jgi:hypothetical protein
MIINICLDFFGFYGFLDCSLIDLDLDSLLCSLLRFFSQLWGNCITKGEVSWWKLLDNLYVLVKIVSFFRLVS